MIPSQLNMIHQRMTILTFSNFGISLTPGLFKVIYQELEHIFKDVKQRVFVNLIVKKIHGLVSLTMIRNGPLSVTTLVALVATSSLSVWMNMPEVKATFWWKKNMPTIISDIIQASTMVQIYPEKHSTKSTREKQHKLLLLNQLSSNKRRIAS